MKRSWNRIRTFSFNWRSLSTGRSVL